MSISFSGLATGLDTSSWVESLVKIKQEKVNSYESTKKTLELTQEAVASIKSFFTSFRSVLEKVTDTKFGAAATDVFAQKLAASTNANIVSAIATNEAEEAKYDVNVDKLATQTKASSGIKQLETITQIQTATLNTKLGDLGVKNGSIDVTVNNVKNNIVISADNSIADFITKLKNIGVESNFNEKTGVFSVDLSKGSLVDNGTGIVEAFHLESSGWESTKLVTYTTTTVTSTASGDTKLSEISSSINSGNVELDVNGATYTVAIDKDMTLSSFVNTLNSYGVDAKLDDDGTLTIKDATISDVDNTNLLEGLGLISDVSSKSQITSGLKFTTVITTGVEATGSTKLSELDGWENISGTPQILIPYDSGTLAIDFTGDSTLDDVVYELNNNSWLKAEFKDGMLTVSGGTVSGNVAELLGLTDKNISKVSTTGEKLYATVVTTATGDTKLADLGITINDDFFTAISIKDGTNYSTIYEQKTMSADATLNDYFAILAGYGINASISDGKITVDSNGKFDSGRIALELGITPSTTTAIVSNSLSSTTPISYTITKTADANTTLGELGLGDKQGYIKGPNEGILATITGSSTMTVGDVLDNLKNQGITASIDNGVISITNSSSYVFTGELAEALGIQTVSTLTGTTIATSTSSSVPLTYTTSTVATADSRISDFVDLSDENSSLNGISVYNKDHSLVTSTQITENTSFGELFSFLAGYGVSASLIESRIYINNTDGKYIANYYGDGNILQQLGIATSTLSSSSETVAAPRTGSKVYYTATVPVSESTLLKDCVDGFVDGETFSVYKEGIAVNTITVTNSMTYGDLYSALQKCNVDVQGFSDSSIYIRWDSEYYVKGDFAERAGLIDNAHYSYNTIIKTCTTGGTVSHTSDRWMGETVTSSEVVQTSIQASDTTGIATKDTKLWQIYYSGSNGGYKEGLKWGFTGFNKGSYFSVTLTLTESTTIGDMMDLLADNGIKTSFDDGKLTIYGGDNYLAHFIHYYNDRNLGSDLFRMKFHIDLSSGNEKYSTGCTVTENTTLMNVSNNSCSSSSEVMRLETSNGTVIIQRKDGTLGDLIKTLKENGLDASLQDGKLTIKQGDNCDTYISYLESTLANNFGLEYGEGVTYYTKPHYRVAQFSTTQSTTIGSNTKLTDLGVEVGDVQLTLVDSTSHKTKNITFTISSTSTLGDYLTWLNNSGYGTNTVDDGRVTVGVGSDSYIYTWNDSAAKLMDKLGLTESLGYYRDYIVTSIYCNTSSYKLEKDTTYTADNSTTLGQLGLVGTGTVEISRLGSGARTVTVSDTDTVADLQNKTFARVDSGILRTDGSGYCIITSMSDNLKDVLKLDVGEGYTYYVSGSTTYSNVTDGTTLIATETGYINENTIIKNINGYSHGSGVISIKDYNDSSYNKTITINQDGTLGDFLTQLRENGLDAYVSDGKVSISASDGLYVGSVEGGSNIISCLQLSGGTTTTVIYDATSDGRTIKLTQTVTATGSTKLNMIYNAPNSIGYPSDDGNLTFDITATDKNGKTLNYQVDAGTESNPITLDELFAKFKTCGIDATIDDGKITLSSTVFSDFTVESEYSNAAALLFGWDKTYEIASNLNTETVTTAVTNATRDTLLKDLGVTAGEFYVYNNGVKYTALISDDETIGSFMDNLKSFGIQTGLMNTDDGTKLMIIGNGDSYIAKSNSTTNASNVVEKLFNNNIDTSYNYIGSEKVSTTTTAMNDATKDTLLSEFDTVEIRRGYAWDENGGHGVYYYFTHKSEGTLEFNVRGEDKTISITSTETFGSLVDKFNEAGIASSFHDGKLYISNAYDINYDYYESNDYSNLVSNISLDKIDAMSGFMASGDVIQETTTSIVEKNLSAANYADFDTTLSSLNISDGTFSIFRNGKKSVITIDSTKTLGYLNTQIASATSADVELKLEDGKMVIYSKTDGVTVEAGTTTDSSNIQAVLGLTKDESGLFSKSTRELYRVNTDTLVTASGMFRLGTVKEGSFTVGTQTITIDNTTTLSDIINQINNSEKANATAYWDSINGKLVIQSRTTGAALINIEAGTSNFTDIMGYTNSKWKDDGSVDETRLNVANQELGSNAKFSINGTKYSATSNTITSDITKIKGLTLNLKDITENNPVTITIEKDKDKVANAIEDVVKSYNELMKNVDEQISSSGKLHDQSTLKIIRNQLRNLMTSSDDGATVFRNLSAIGISVSSASAKNTSTSNESIIDLSFDKDKFLEAYAKDADAVKALLVGGANNKGVFTKVEDLIESSLKSVTGYFDVTEKSIKSDISKNAMKITKANEAIERYRAQLEKKFSSMNLMISKAQQQYSSFLS